MVFHAPLPRSPYTGSWWLTLGALPSFRTQKPHPTFLAQLLPDALYLMVFISFLYPKGERGGARGVRELGLWGACASGQAGVSRSWMERWESLQGPQVSETLGCGRKRGLCRVSMIWVRDRDLDHVIAYLQAFWLLLDRED